MAYAVFEALRELGYSGGFGQVMGKP